MEQFTQLIFPNCQIISKLQITVYAKTKTTMPIYSIYSSFSALIQVDHSCYFLKVMSINNNILIYILTSREASSKIGQRGQVLPVRGLNNHYFQSIGKGGMNQTTLFLFIVLQSPLILAIVFRNKHMMCCQYAAKFGSKLLVNFIKYDESLIQQVLLFINNQILFRIAMKVKTRQQKQQNNTFLQNCPTLPPAKQHPSHPSIVQDNEYEFNRYLYRLNYYPNENSHFKIIIITIIRSLVSSISLFAYFQMSQLNNGQQTFWTGIFNYIMGLSLVFTIIVYILIGTVLLITLYFTIVVNHQSSLVTEVDKNLLDYLHYSVELIVPVSAMLCLFQPVFGGCALCISSMINMLACFLWQNYLNRKDLFYCTSVQTNLILKLIIILHYIIMVTSFYHQSLILFTVLPSINMLLALIWYFKAGHMLYLHPNTYRYFIIFFSLYCTTTTLILSTINIQLNTSVSAVSIYQYFILFIIFYLVFIIYSYFFNQSIVNQLKDLVNADIRSVQLMLFSLDSQQKSQDILSLLHGLLKCHQFSGCSRKSCYSNHSHIYDSHLKKKLSHSQQNKELFLLAKFYILCFYQHKLKKNSNCKDRLQYCEFVYNQFGNTSVLIQELVLLKQSNITFCEKVLSQKLWRKLKQDSDYLNRIIYDGNLEIQNVINSEKVYKVIQEDMNQFVLENISIWEYIRMAEVSLTALKEKIKKCSLLQRTLSESWNKIVKYFAVHSRWKFMYFNYLLFIKTQRLKQKEIDQFGMTPDENIIFDANSIFLEQSEKKQKKIINRNILFNPDCCCFHAAFEMRELIIKKISIGFIKITGFGSEIVGNNVSILLSQQLKTVHIEKVRSWINEGYSRNEENYQIQFTACITKTFEQVPIVKYYKLFLNLDSSEGEYVCLMKKNQKQSKQQLKTSCVEQIGESQEQLQDKFEVATVKQNQYSLCSDSNIFIKDEVFKPVREIKEIIQIKFIIRVFTFSFILTIVALTFLTKSNIFQLSAYSEQYINFLQIYRLPMVLGTDYYKQILSLDNQTYVAQQIERNTAQIQSISANSLTLKTLFDVRINLQKNYGPVSVYGSNNEEYYDQLQIYFQMASSIISLKDLPIEQEGDDFIMMRQLIIPSYNSILNSTKNQIHLSFANIFESIESKEKLFILGQSLLVACFFLLILWRVYHFSRKMTEIIKTIIQFSLIDLNDIHYFWIKVKKLLAKFQRRNKQLATFRTSIASKQRRQEVMKDSGKRREMIDSVSLNKRNKKIEMDQQAKKIKVKLFFLVSTVIILCLVIVITCSMSIISKFKQLSVFQNQGYKSIQYFPCMAILDYGILQKAYSLKHPTDTIFNSDKYEMMFAGAFNFGNTEYIGQIIDDSSQFYLKRKNYFYSNPCLQNTDIYKKRGITLEQCSKILNSSFSTGISTAMRTSLKRVEPFIRGSQVLADDQLIELSLSMDLIGRYVYQIIETWGEEFNARVTAITSLSVKLIAVQVGLILGLYLIFEGLVISQLRQEYGFYRYVFQKMVPQNILLREKIIKQKFISEHILVKS